MAPAATARLVSAEGLARLVNGEQRQKLAGHPLASARRAARGLAGLAFDYRGLRRRILRTFMFHAVAPVTPVVAIENDGLRFLVETADLGPGRIMFTRGSLERDVLATAVELAARHLDVSERHFVDVGANVGAASILALGRHGFKSAIAVEPNAGNAALLRANLAINGLEDRCTTVLAAAGGTDGSVELELSPDNFGDHRIRARGAGPGDFREETRPTQAVPLYTLDTILGSHGVAPEDVGMLWVDVQGYEADVLRGAGSLIAASVPVVIEFWPYGLQRSGGLEALCDFVESHFASFVDLHAANGSDDGLVHRPIEDLRAFEPVGEGDATDLLLVH